MKPTKQLIIGLRETAALLRSGESGYNWTESADCNCGLLARSLGVSRDDITNCATWTANAEDPRSICCFLGKPMVEVIEYLLGCGLEINDFYEIEYLGDHRLDLYKDPLAVAAWMDKQADELERRRKTEWRDERDVPRPCQTNSMPQMLPSLVN